MSKPPLLLAVCLLLAFAFFFFFQSIGFFHATNIGLSAFSAPRRTAQPQVGIYELRKGDFSLKITNFGATILSLFLPDSKGNVADVVLGYDRIAHYINDTAYFGALVGRVANRIAGGHFLLNRKVYKLPINSGKNTLHGGNRGFNKVIWTVKEKGVGEFPYITLYYHSFDGEEGFPGDLDVYVTYKISGPYELTVNMNATAKNKATPVNLAQHSYWNLGGHNNGVILSHLIQIFATEITPVDDNLIPTGSFQKVAGTPYDFREPTSVGSRIDQIPGGYDVNYVLSSLPNAHGMRKVALVQDPQSGRALALWANQPGVQFYSGNFLNNVSGKGGHVYGQHNGLCLETQGFPDAVNHYNFPSQIVNPGQVYRHDMLFRFSF
ncbi:Aldose 1-epimerase [Rhynchospora pubera]|uniref:Aldose 1-epimerase n=1 Tax=Rhynchospora pubera TaxID=906938 RepID=A0AAV8GVU2_9POAL|nr:Aldose 1-epimerase [Rhynchospora pubera]